jgi:thioredoxin reductase (NADPH)
VTPAEQDDEQFYRDTEAIAFPKLTDEQLALLERFGIHRKLKRGDSILKAGQREFPLTIVLEGEIEAFERRDGVEQILATAGPRDFLGDVSMLQGTSALANARVKSDEAEVLQVPAPELRRILAEIPKIGEPILNALIMRRMRLKRDKEFAGLRILSEADSRDGRQLDDFLEKNHIPHRLVDLKTEQGAALASRLHLLDRDLPALITPTGAPLRRPSLREVAQVAGLLRPLAADDEEEIECDLVIVGAGPAGLAAAVYATSEGLNTVVLESYATGGQAGSSSLIENFFGFPTGISGGDLTWRAQLQAYRFGAKFSTPSQALTLVYHPEKTYRVSLQIEGCPALLCARSVVIATGAHYNRLDAEGRARFEGVGVFYAATALEGRLCRGANVFIRRRGEGAAGHPREGSFPQHVGLPVAPGPGAGKYRAGPEYDHPADDGQFRARRGRIGKPHDRGTPNGQDAGGVLDDRRDAVHGMVAAGNFAGQQGVHQNRSAGRRCSDVEEHAAFAGGAGDELPWCVCGRRRSRRLGQTLRGRRGRREYGDRRSP